MAHVRARISGGGLCGAAVAADRALAGRPVVVVCRAPSSAGLWARGRPRQGEARRRRIWRSRRVARPGIPQYPVGHARRVQQLAQPGLAFVGWGTSGVGLTNILDDAARQTTA